MHIRIDFGTFSVLLAALLWGTTGTAAAFAPQLSPLAIGAFAMGFGGLLQALVAKEAIKNSWRIIAMNPWLLLMSVISVGIYPLSFYSSMHLAGITIGTVVSIGSAPLFSALIEYFVDKQPLSMRWLVGFLLGITGVLLLSLSESASYQGVISIDQKILGIGLGLVAGLTYCLYSYGAKKFMDQGANAKASMGTIFGFGALLLLPTLFFTADNLFDDPHNVYVVTYMAVIPMFIGYLLFGYGLKTTVTSTAITLTLFEPVVAALLAVFIMGERLSWQGWIGIVLIFCCLFVLSVKKVMD